MVKVLQNKEVDPYIQLLRLGKNDLINNRPISYGEFKVRLVDLKINVQPSILFKEVYGSASGGPGGFLICLEAYMKLLEYDELQHALKESLQARKEAKWAIWISIFVGVIPVLLWLFDQFNKS